MNTYVMSQNGEAGASQPAATPAVGGRIEVDSLAVVLMQAIHAQDKDLLEKCAASSSSMSHFLFVCMHFHGQNHVQQKLYSILATKNGRVVEGFSSLEY